MLARDLPAVSPPGGVLKFENTESMVARPRWPALALTVRWSQRGWGYTLSRDLVEWIVTQNIPAEVRFPLPPRYEHEV